MKKIYNKIFVDHVSDEKLEIIYAFSVFAVIFFAVRTVLIYDGILRAYDFSAAGGEIFHSRVQEMAENDILEVSKALETDDAFTEEPEEASDIVPEVAEKKVVPQAKISSKNKYVIAGGIKAPTISTKVKRDGENRRVCSSKSDNPHDSYQNKSIHIDKECCLDPDEIPNPRCYYSSSKYGKLLAKYEKKKTKFLERYRKNH